MRRSVLTGGLVACGLVTIWPAPAFAAQLTPVPALARAADQQEGWKPWFRFEAPNFLTVPLGPTWIDPWPFGPCCGRTGNGN